MSFTVKHKRSGDVNSRPKPSELENGQVAINFNGSSPGLFFRLSNGEIAKAGPSIVSSSVPTATNYTGFGLGETWIDTSSGNTLKFWDGNIWRAVEYSAGAAQARVTISDIAPLAPENGDLWWNSQTGVLMVYYVETGTAGLTQQWSQATRPNANTAEDFVFNDDIIPTQNNTFDIGSENYRVRELFTGDINLSNKGSQNDVDGSWGSYLMQEGEDDLFLINRRTGKKYRFMLEEVN